MPSHVSMSARRLCLVLTAISLLVAAAPGAALGAPPANDNYLTSIPINRANTELAREEVRDIRDTREATVQSDLFSPSGTGGGAERTDCNGTRFGNTIWYDFHPDSFGTAEIQTAGFDATVALYEFDPNSSRIIRSLGCQNTAGVTEDFFAQVERGRSYTVQIGGVDAGAGPASGELQMTFQFFGDLDRDGVFDPLDRCPRIAGVQGRGGCPPEVRSIPKMTAAPTASGIQVRSISVRASRGSTVALGCRRGCSARERRRGSGRLTDLNGRSLQAGSVFEIRVTKRGHVGAVHRYTVLAGNFRRTDRCTLPGSTKVRRRCP